MTQPTSSPDTLSLDPEDRHTIASALADHAQMLREQAAAQAEQLRRATRWYDGPRVDDGHLLVTAGLQAIEDHARDLEELAGHVRSSGADQLPGTLQAGL